MIRVINKKILSNIKDARWMYIMTNDLPLTIINCLIKSYAIKIPSLSDYALSKSVYIIKDSIYHRYIDVSQQKFFLRAVEKQGINSVISTLREEVKNERKVFIILNREAKKLLKTNIKNDSLIRLLKKSEKTVITGLSAAQIPIYISLLHEKRKINLPDKIIHSLGKMRDNHVKPGWEFIGIFNDQMIPIIADKLSISKEQVGAMFFDEIILSLKKGKLAVPEEELDKRNSLLVIYQDNDSIYCSTDDTAKNISQFFESLASKNDVLKGTVIYKGKVKGIAKAIKSYEDLHKIKQGDILVTYKTTVHYVPYIKKIRAIVTQEGGLTSHMAVISREMKIPCIVGVKNVMNTIKSGDLIEVDAIKGIIKKLNGGK